MGGANPAPWGELIGVGSLDTEAIPDAVICNAGHDWKISKYKDVCSSLAACGRSCFATPPTVDAVALLYARDAEMLVIKDTIYGNNTCYLNNNWMLG